MTTILGRQVGAGLELRPKEWTAVHVDTIAAKAHHELTHRTSRLRAWRFEFALLVATIVAGLFAWIARTVGYFTVDVELARAIQSIENPWVVMLFDGLSWIGYPPQVAYIAVALVVVLFVMGLRTEAVLLLISAAGGAGLWFWLEQFVDRPRPSPELVRVMVDLHSGSFPSGHVLNLMGIFGFLIYLGVVLLADVRWRAVVIVALGLPILLVGFARVYEGAHWPSDVLGGFLIGGIWLGLTIQIYRWAKARFSGGDDLHHHDRDAPDGHRHAPDARQPA